MARVLIGTVPVAGHVGPMAPLARGLVEAGHEVVWYSGTKYRRLAEAAGAHFAPRRQAIDYDDATLEHVPERHRFDGLAQLKFDLKHVFIDDVPGQVADLRAIAATFPPDVLLGDAAFAGAGILQEVERIKIAVLSVVPMSLSSIDTAPFGLGLLPTSSTLGRLRNRGLQWAVENVVFADVQRHWLATRDKLGLGKGRFLMDFARDAELFMQPTIPSFEYPRTDLPSSVRFIGRMPVAPPNDWTRPSWWAELDSGKPVVHVTQGTVANTKPSLFKPAIEGLAREDVLVVISTGGRDAASLGLRELPANVRVHSFLSYPELLPKTSVMLTNGGYGGVQMALASGVPVIVAGTTEDKPEVAGRVVWSGAGLSLKTSTPQPSAVRCAVRRLLDEPSFRARARALADEHARYDAVKRGVELISQLVRGGRARGEN